MRKNGISQIPVVDQDEQLIGMISEVDILDRLLAPDQTVELGDRIEPMVVRDVFSVPFDTPFDTILNELLTVKVAVLVDQENKPVDILTTIDALDYFASPSGA
jgi:predicted transcriptional regulator